MVISALYNITINSAVELELTEQNLKMSHGKIKTSWSMWAAALAFTVSLGYLCLMLLFFI